MIRARVEQEQTEQNICESGEDSRPPHQVHLFSSILSRLLRVSVCLSASYRNRPNVFCATGV